MICYLQAGVRDIIQSEFQGLRIRGSDHVTPSLKGVSPRVGRPKKPAYLVQEKEKMDSPVLEQRENSPFLYLFVLWSLNQLDYANPHWSGDLS